MRKRRYVLHGGVLGRGKKRKRNEEIEIGKGRAEEKVSMIGAALPYLRLLPSSSCSEWECLDRGRVDQQQTNRWHHTTSRHSAPSLPNGSLPSSERLFRGLDIESFKLRELECSDVTPYLFAGLVMRCTMPRPDAVRWSEVEQLSGNSQTGHRRR